MTKLLHQQREETLVGNRLTSHWLVEVIDVREESVLEYRPKGDSGKDRAARAAQDHSKSRRAVSLNRRLEGDADAVITRLSNGRPAREQRPGPCLTYLSPSVLSAAAAGEVRCLGADIDHRFRSAPDKAPDEY